MKFRPTLLAALMAGLFATTAGAQLKMPQDKSVPAQARPGNAPAAPAAGSAPAARENAEKEAAGQLAAAGWLLLLDRRDWGRAWETSSSIFRGSVPLATWMDSIPKVREPLGVFVERTPAGSGYKTSLAGRPDGEYVTTIFDSKFDKKAVQEIVTTVREADGKWRVTGYSPR